MLVDILDSVTMFNEVSSSTAAPTRFTVIAAKDSIIWNADYQTLQGLADRYPQVALGFLPVLATRTRVLISMVADVCFSLGARAHGEAHPRSVRSWRAAHLAP